MLRDENKVILQKDTIEYIIRFLMKENITCNSIYYGSVDQAPKGTRIIIIPWYFYTSISYDSAGTQNMALEYLNNSEKTPILFGNSEIRKEGNQVILYADIIYSTFFLLSRREEVIKRERRDQYGRFLAQYSFLSENGMIFRPIVDEYARYIRKLIYKIEGKVYNESYGFQKIWLTHDIDIPFYYSSLKKVLKQWIINLLPQYNTEQAPLCAYFNIEKDPYCTFSRMIRYDASLKEELNEVEIETIYFLITAKPKRNNQYFDINSRKYQKLLRKLISSKASFGIHISHEAGVDPEQIEKEIERFPFLLQETLYSRHHFLRWREPEHVIQMEMAGITDDFTLAYPDCVGFRVGTCHPYRFINPVSGKLSNIIIHPLEIMECSLDRKMYMGLNYDEALKKCKEIISKVFEYNGELNLLFHNTSFVNDGFNYTQLYIDSIEYIKLLNNETLRK